MTENTESPAPNAKYVRLYDCPLFDDQDDYLSDVGLARIKVAILDKLPADGFDMPYCDATARGVQPTIMFDKPSGPMQNAETFVAMLRAVTVVRTLHANLVAARAALAHIDGSGAGGQ